MILTKKQRYKARRRYAYWARRIRVCPKCQYRVDKMEIKNARYDYPCPRCNEATLSQFRPIKLVFASDIKTDKLQGMSAKKVAIDEFS